jgi:murein DD-endopeptidase MepM/ murein hydrolase activator NlpD
MSRVTAQPEQAEEVVIAHPAARQALGGERSVWVWPLPILADRWPVISHRCGTRRRSADGSTRPHLGVDIMYERRGRDDLASEYPRGSPNGTRRHFMPDDVPVLAAADGVVRLTAWSSRELTVVVRHAANWTTCYAHLAELDVAPDQAVVAGEPIGTVGHDPADQQGLKCLRFELWSGGTRRGAVDPAPYLAHWRHVGLTAWSPAAASSFREPGAPTAATPTSPAAARSSKSP